MGRLAVLYVRHTHCARVTVCAVVTVVTTAGPRTMNASASVLHTYNRVSGTACAVQNSA
jgi:hypothetical protein